ncbi:hypothetical protein EYC84_005772 [Monilinia fructicola]|uniref:Uncharacterized protein n=1 Tax=Monilinia fructicola TaxID=38448 RepID=A0A5M9K057_MONFR|nr:hypothetical protein EYC84_005772 [Monilinia fructicola]
MNLRYKYFKGSRVYEVSGILYIPGYLPASIHLLGFFPLNSQLSTLLSSPRLSFFLFSLSPCTSPSPSPFLLILPLSLPLLYFC